MLLLRIILHIPPFHFVQYSTVLYYCAILATVRSKDIHPAGQPCRSTTKSSDEHLLSPTRSLSLAERAFPQLSSTRACGAVGLYVMPPRHSALLFTASSPFLHGSFLRRIPPSRSPLRGTCPAARMSTDPSAASTRDAPRNQGSGGQKRGRRRQDGASGRGKQRGRDAYSGDPTAGPRLIPREAPSSYNQEGTAVLWFRNDLRLGDNAALALANTAARMVPVYVFDERAYGMDYASPHGFQRTGPFRAKFIVESVTVLRRALRWKMSDLIMRLGFPEEAIGEVVETLVKAGMGPVRVVVQKECMRDEVEAEKRVEEAVLEAGGVGVDYVWGMTMLHPEDLNFNPIGPALPATFTDFRKKVEAEPAVAVRDEIAVPEVFQTFPRELGIESDDFPTLGEDLGVQGLSPPHDYVFPHPRAVMKFEGGEETGMERMDDWIFKKRCLGTYFESRNDSGTMDFSSKFSPWLALGCISPRTVYWACKRYEETVEENKSTYWMVFELLTRDYFRWIAGKAGDTLFALNGFSGRANDSADIWSLPEGSISVEDKRNFEAWVAGNTGAPFVDAHMRELNCTGFMSNRGRQNAASFLIHDLRYPDWRAGAEYFESQLIDHDVASNWGNWAYIAGVGSDPRGGRRFNVVKQAMQYDESGWFTKRWCDALLMVPPPYVHEPHLLSEDDLLAVDVEKGVSYPLPIVPLMRGPKRPPPPEASTDFTNESLPSEDPSLSADERKKLKEEAAKALEELSVGLATSAGSEDAGKFADADKFAEAEERARKEAEKFI